MKKIYKIIPLVLAFTLLMCGCGIGLPDDLSYTQIADPSLAHIITDDMITYLPSGESKGKIFLDPGHGYSDPGVVGANYDEDNICESFIVFEISRKVLSLLVSEGYEVMMCRESDYDIRQESEVFKVQPEERTRMANDWGADFFLSLHINSYDEDPSVNYLLCSYTTKSSPDDATMDAFCNYIMTNLTASIGERATNIESNRASTGYYVNTRANMPSILLEMGFITNPTDYENFINTSWQQVAADGITKGIVSIMNSAEYASYKASLTAE